MPKPTEKTVLLVDDDPDLRNITSLILGLHGYKVMGAANGEEGVQIFRENAGKIELVISDMVMPGMDGQDLWRALRETNRDISFLMLSGHSEEHARSTLKISNDVSILTKPCSSQALLATIQKILNRPH